MPGSISVAGNFLPLEDVSYAVELHNQWHQRAQLKPALARILPVSREIGERDMWFVTIADALLHNEAPIDTWLPLLIRFAVAKGNCSGTAVIAF